MKLHSFPAPRAVAGAQPNAPAERPTQQSALRYFVYCRRSSEAEDRQIMSIESQRQELQKVFGNRPEIDVVDILEESKSAKSPGRPIFSEMLKRIHKGEASGIIAWAPDRLARNSIDGGQIVYLLDCGIIRDLKFATYTFENNSQGKFMLQIMFGQSKYYSDALSENVKRGNRTKLEQGWRPNTAPLGYMNDPRTKTTVKDPDHFPLVRKMFQMMLTGGYTPKEIALIARDEWGFRTPKRRKIGGVPLAMSSIYKILSNPFYAGMILWGGKLYPGKHEPVVSIESFERVRQLLDRPGRARRKKYRFAFTGLIRCASCGLMVTAEHKVNRYGYRYVYYHCSKRQLGPRCPERSVELTSLEQQIETFLESLTVHDTALEWIESWSTSEKQRDDDSEQARKRSLESARENVRGQLHELTGLRLRAMISDDEFTMRRRQLHDEETTLSGKIAEIERAADWFEPFRAIISFRNQAPDLFRHGDDQTKRRILEIVSSNLVLKDKKLSIQAAKPFAISFPRVSSPRLRADVDDVRTFLRSNESLPLVARIMDWGQFSRPAGIPAAA